MTSRILHRLQIAQQLAGAVAPGGVSRLGWLLRTACLPKEGRRTKAIPFTLRERSFSVKVRAFRELAPFLEVFVAKDYAGPWEDCRTILDIGANIGAASLYFLAVAPQARVVAYEPDPYNFALLQDNLAGSNRAEALNLAISDQNGKLDFYRRDGYNLGASITTQREGFHRIEVPAIRLSEALDHAGFPTVDLVKFDIEGAEWRVFSDPLATARVERFIGEYHEDLAGHPVAEFIGLFPDHEVSVTQIASQRFVCRGVRRSSPRH